MSVDSARQTRLDAQRWVRSAVFTASAFLSAFLLFLVQPMAAKRLLPAFGGTPAVWTVAMLFFQGVLLGGYLYAHFLAGRLDLRFQVVLHLGFFVGVILLGFGPAGPIEPDRTSDWTTTLDLLLALGSRVGLPFLLLASTAPLLQSWYANPHAEPSRDPYFLYVASNLGSLAALLLYPLLVERWLELDDQFQRWRLGVELLGLGIAFSGALVFLETRASVFPTNTTPLTRDDFADWAYWVFLAFVPSSLLLGVTVHITADLSSIPLLWIIPLSLYLISFIIAFSQWNQGVTRFATRVYPAVFMALALILGFGVVKAFLLPLHAVGFFLAAMVCHGELAERRPDPSRLTGFYLAMSVGGCLGGVFNGVLAPLLFRSVVEYPLGLVLAALVVAVRLGKSRPTKWDFVIPAVLGIIAALFCGNVGGVAESAVGVLATVLISGFVFLIAVRQNRQPLRFALMVAALLAASHFWEGVNGRLLLQERSFFGVTRVTEVPEGPFHRMFHGNTLHGQQGFSKELRHRPLTYFSESGPIGDIFRARRAMGPIGKITVAGLGAGSLLTYAQPGENWTVHEIDPVIVRIATDPRYFTYVEDCSASSLKLLVGDARLEIAKQPPAGDAMIFLDAFSSDAIPMHLLTREALAIYREKCRADGWLIFNISTRYLDLLPVVGKLAEDAGWACRARVDYTPGPKSFEKSDSIWAVMAPSESQLGGLGSDPRWFRPTWNPWDRVWTDGHADVLRHLRRRPVSGSR